MTRSVVITGMGAVSPLGSDLETTWQAMLKGESGVGPITLFDATTFPCRIAAEVKKFNINEWLSDDDLLKYLSRGARFGVAATQMALADAALAPGYYKPERTSVSMASCGGRPTLESLVFVQRAIANHSGSVKYPTLDPFWVMEWTPHSGTNIIAFLVDARGPSYVLHTACAASSQAIGTAFRLIQRGDADVVIAGGYDSMISEVDLIGFSLLGALSTRNDEPGKASRPFDRKRDGFVLGEGAAMVVLEDMSMAVARGARIHAELTGFGCSLNIQSIVDSPADGSGATEAMTNALNDAGLKPGDIDYVNAHGTSTPNNDLSETAAIKRVFGEYAYRVPVSSTKSMTGHLIATAGALELATCVMVVRDSMLPPTINYEYQDPKCDLYYIPNRSIAAKVNHAMSNSFAFGGSNSCLIVKKYEGA